MKDQNYIMPVNGPVLVTPSVLLEKPRKIELRIGEARQGESRYALLTPKEALRLAAILIEAAEESYEKAAAQP